LRFDEPPFDVTAPNITPDPETGIGKWSDADVKRALLDGVRPDGVKLAAVMPSAFYNILAPGDLDGIVAYLRSLEPVSNKVRDPAYKMQTPYRLFGSWLPLNCSAALAIFASVEGFKPPRARISRACSFSLGSNGDLVPRSATSSRAWNRAASAHSASGQQASRG
jgi:hypothetical protein